MLKNINSKKNLLNTFKVGDLVYGFRETAVEIEKHLRKLAKENNGQEIYYKIENFRLLLPRYGEDGKEFWRIASEQIINDNKVDINLRVNMTSLQLGINILLYAAYRAKTKTKGSYIKNVFHIFYVDTAFVCKLGIDYIVNNIKGASKLHFIIQAPAKGYPKVTESAPLKNDYGRRFTEKEMRSLFRWFLLKPEKVNKRVIFWPSYDLCTTPQEEFTKKHWLKYSLSLFKKYRASLDNYMGIKKPDDDEILNLKDENTIMNWYKQVGTLRKKYLKSGTNDKNIKNYRKIITKKLKKVAKKPGHLKL